MKKFILYLSLVSIIVACNKAGGEDKKAQLEELKKQKGELQVKIDSLEAQIKRTSKDSINPITVSLMALKAEVFNNYIDVQGKVDADENVAISSEMPGTITKSNIKVGDEVSAGQVLAETDAKAYYQQLSDLQTNADLVKQVYEKQKALWDQKIGSEVQFLQAKTNHESMQKKIAAVHEQIKMTKIISPINGTIDAVDIKIGQAVAPGLPAIRVINFSNLKVKADVAETYASKIKKGSDAIIFFPDMKDSIKTKVNFVSRAINASSRTFNVEILLDGKKEYHPNMVAHLNINDYKSEQPVIAIPVKTIQKDENNASFVYIADGKKAKKQIVKLGKEYKGMAEITEGLKAGDKLITLGYEIINDGDLIEY